MGTSPSDTTARRRGRPARIGRDDIVDAALAVGLDALSIQAVADRLGVSAAALYSHVAGRDEIVQLAHDRLRARLAAVAPDQDRWDGWLRAFAVGVRRHVPASASGFLESLDGAGVERVLVGETGLRLLIDAGLPPLEAGRAVWLVFRTAVAADDDRVLAELLGATGHLLPGGPTEELTATRRVHEALTAGPTATDEVGGDAGFAFDLDLVLAGIAARIAGHAGAASPLDPPTGT